MMSAPENGIDINYPECLEDLKEESSVEEEDEYLEDYSTDIEYDRRAYGIYQQLPIRPGTPDLSTGPPQTAEEYLRRVRYDLLMRTPCSPA
jgi:hypothetical protein